MDRKTTGLFLVLLAVAVFGGAQSWIAANTNIWRDRLLSGETIIVKLICGAEHSLRCPADYQLRYSVDPLCEHVVIDGGIDGEQLRRNAPEFVAEAGADRLLSPAAIAETYWQLHEQQRSAWTHELDLRPYRESF